MNLFKRRSNERECIRTDSSSSLGVVVPNSNSSTNATGTNACTNLSWRLTSSPTSTRTVMTMSTSLILRENIVHCKWSAVIDHLTKYPKDAKETLIVSERGNKSARLPLHEACRHRAPQKLIAALIYLYPSAVRCRDSLQHFMPIHFATRFGCDPDVVDLLAKAYPPSVLKTDKFGFTPRDLSRNCSSISPANKEKIKKILEQDFNKTLAAAADDDDNDNEDNHHHCDKALMQRFEASMELDIDRGTVGTVVF